MRAVRKVIALLLGASCTLTVCSCSAIFRNGFVEAADQIAQAAVARDYESLELIADEGDRKLQNILDLLKDTGDEENEAGALIASTLSYDVIEESFRSDSLGTRGSVDVSFSYSDYSEAVSNRTIFWDIEEFGDVLALCQGKVVTTITFYFIKEDGKLLCTNISDITALYPYSSLDLDFAGNEADYVGEFEFTGDNQISRNFGLCDICMINCSLAVTGDGQRLPWHYYCTVDKDGAEVFTSGVIDVLAPEALDISYTDVDPDTGVMADGTYTFSFYTDDDELIAESSINVTHTISADDAVSPSSTLGDQYIYSDSDQLILPECDLVSEQPDNMHFCAPESPEVQLAVDEGMGDSVITIISGDEGGPCEDARITIIDVGINIDCSSDVNISYIDSFMDDFIAEYEAEGYTCTQESFYYTVGDREYYVNRFTAETDSESICITYMLLGDEDNTYIASWLTTDLAESDNILNSLSPAA